ncbi:hypothetical protein J2P12_00675 [Candidatus Bathyarchaeota archaeon]|nr:hypothetical protein [Candidatus Bathyarchaeota archaeon]
MNQCATANTWTAAGSGASNATYQTTTAATAASAIALGAGATNNNSANAGAGAASLAMTLNINVGDFVIIFTDTQDTSLTLTDNGSGGGNTYLQLGQVATNRGKGIMWYVQSATVSASQVTVADAANAYSMSGATYVNVLGIGTPITPATGSTNSLTMSVTTLAANSLVVGCFQYNTATTFTPTSGSVVTQSFNGTNTVNTSMMSITTTTVGTYTLSATTNQGTPVWQGLAIELKASGAVNHNSPVLTLGGTGWNGSSSINELTTLQAVVPNVTNPVPVLTATPTFSVVNNGVFNNTANGPYISASINGSNPASEFTGVSRTSSQIQNSAIYGGITIPSFSTQFETHGLFGAIRNYSTTTYGVGGYFSALAGAASTKTFGANMIVMDGGFAATNLVGAEIDITQSNADSGSVTAVSNGLRILSNGTHRPASGIYIVGSGGTNDNFLAPLLIDDANSGDTNPTRMIYLIPPDNLNTTTAFQLRNHANNADVLTMSDAGAITPSLYQSQTNCSSAGGTCSAAQAGSVTIAAAATTVTVATTAVTANSQIFVQEDSSLGTKLSVTCNTTTGRTYTITTRTAGTSFVITASAAPTTNPACLSYFIVN